MKYILTRFVRVCTILFAPDEMHSQEWMRSVWKEGAVLLGRRETVPWRPKLCIAMGMGHDADGQVIAGISSESLQEYHILLVSLGPVATRIPPALFIREVDGEGVRLVLTSTAWMEVKRGGGGGGLERPLRPHQYGLHSGGAAGPCSRRSGQAVLRG